MNQQMRRFFHYIEIFELMLARIDLGPIFVHSTLENIYEFVLCRKASLIHFTLICLQTLIFVFVPMSILKKGLKVLKTVVCGFKAYFC